MAFELDDLDRKILRLLQEDASRPLEEIAQATGSSKTPVWNRIKRLKSRGVIKAQVALAEPEAVGLDHCFFVLVRTSQHEPDWLDRFTRAVRELPEILEAHRLTGEIDYILKVRVRNVAHFDAFYKSLVERVNIYNVTSSLSMEAIKETTALPV